MTLSLALSLAVSVVALLPLLMLGIWWSWWCSQDGWAEEPADRAGRPSAASRRSDEGP